MTKDRLVIELPPQLKRQLRVVAAERGVTLKEIVIDALSAWLERQARSEEGDLP